MDKRRHLDTEYYATNSVFHFEPVEVEPEDNGARTIENLRSGDYLKLGPYRSCETQSPWFRVTSTNLGFIKTACPDCDDYGWDAEVEPEEIDAIGFMSDEPSFPQDLFQYAGI